MPAARSRGGGSSTRLRICGLPFSRWHGCCIGRSAPCRLRHRFPVRSHAQTTCHPSQARCAQGRTPGAAWRHSRAASSCRARTPAGSPGRKPVTGRPAADVAAGPLDGTAPPPCCAALLVARAAREAGRASHGSGASALRASRDEPATAPALGQRGVVCLRGALKRPRTAPRCRARRPDGTAASRRHRSTRGVAARGWRTRRDSGLMSA